MKRAPTVLCLLLLAALAAAPSAAERPLEVRAVDALARATKFFRSRVSVDGSYLWTYSEDLKTRRGEEEATSTQGWVQPPGTPSVGRAYLRAWKATGERAYLDAAKEAARALARTQLASGGWDYRIEFDPERGKQWYYRRDVDAGDKEPGARRNTSTFDDDNSQSALRLLMRVDTALGREDPEVRRAAEYGLTKLLEAQYPNGAWPQRYDGKRPDPPEYPVRRARYPETWSRTHPGARYQEHYTFNDGAMGDIIRTLLEAHRTYGKPAHLDAARKGGDFILLTQMPAPQPVWAQQYNREMEPAWARRFEPPGVASGESAGVVRTLLDLYLNTGDEKYRKPIAPAVEWFRRSRLPGGRWARFYELRTNRPLYFNKRYELVYTDDDLPTHYSFQSEYGIPGVLARFERITRDGRDKYLASERRPRTEIERRRDARQLEPRVREIIAALDPRGRWVEDGTIRSDTFIRNVQTLADYIAAVRGKDLEPDR